jgi:hypothetical protein
MRGKIRRLGMTWAFVAASSLLLPFSSACAEVINLNCGVGVSFWIDTDRKTITFLPSGVGPAESPADINDHFIKWKSEDSGDFSYQIDRLTGVETMFHNGRAFPAGKCVRGSTPKPAAKP